jgi:ribosomal protein S18 acetylase RimI-like enzyme
MDLHARGWSTLAYLHRLCAEHSPGGAVAELDGYVLCTVPDAADSPWLNVAVPVGDTTSTDRLAGWFEGRGAGTWGIWTEGGERVQGLYPSADPVAMGARMEDVDVEGAAGEPVGLGLVGTVNDIAYAHLDARLERITPRLEGRVRAFGLEGAAVALSCEHDGDAGIYYVATLPDARGRGLARAVVKRALADARERGCTSTTLQASDMGARLYESLGYERTGPLKLWEHAP